MKDGQRAYCSPGSMTTSQREKLTHTHTNTKDLQSICQTVANEPRSRCTQMHSMTNACKMHVCTHFTPPLEGSWRWSKISCQSLSTVSTVDHRPVNKHLYHQKSAAAPVTCGHSFKTMYAALHLVIGVPSHHQGRRKRTDAKRDSKCERGRETCRRGLPQL